MRLVRNDLGMDGHELDNDGLGRELEADLGTCGVKTDVAEEALLAQPRSG